MTIASVEKTRPAKRLPRYRRASQPPPMQLTARDIRIVRWVYEMRFVTREQIERLEFSPSTASYCKRRLALLFHHGLLDRNFIPAVNSLGSTRAIYTLASKGARLVAHELSVGLRDLRWRPIDSDRELYFLKHTLAANDFRTAVEIAARELGYAVDWTDERTLRRREMRDYVADPRRDGEKLPIIPDGYFQLRKDDQVIAFALELDRATVEEKPFKAKIRAYGEWKRTGAYQRRHGTHGFRVLFVVERTKRDPHRLARVKKWCESEGGRTLFWFCDYNVLARLSALHSPIWQVAGRDGRYSLLTGGQ